MSDHPNRPINAARTGESPPSAETDVGDELLVDDITTVTTPVPVEQPVDVQALADPVDVGVLKDQGDAHIGERSIDSDDIIGVRGSPVPQIDHSYVSDGESTDGEGDDEEPPPDVDVDEPTDGDTPVPPEPSSTQWGILDVIDAWARRGGNAGSDFVVAQTDEDGIPIDQDDAFGFGGLD